jgi:hypothetical protein
MIPKYITFPLIAALASLTSGLASCTRAAAPETPPEQDLLVPPGRSEAFLEMELPPNHFTHSEGRGERYAGGDAGHVANLCLNCHTTTQTSFATEDWAGSLHALVGIGCEACHGTHEAGFVPHPGPDRCRACHPQQETELRRGQHVDTAGSGIRCDSCHRAHAFELDEVKDPSSCTSCHRESEHVQTYARSKMATIFAREGFDEDGVPAAATCHMCHMRLSEVHEHTSDLRCDTVMDHDVSGMLVRLKGDEARLDEVSRKRFVQICLQCHARAISEYRLEHADPILTTWKAGGR